MIRARPLGTSARSPLPLSFDAYDALRLEVGRLVFQVEHLHNGATEHGTRSVWSLSPKTNAQTASSSVTSGAPWNTLGALGLWEHVKRSCLIWWPRGNASLFSRVSCTTAASVGGGLVELGAAAPGIDGLSSARSWRDAAALDNAGLSRVVPCVCRILRRGPVVMWRMTVPVCWARRRASLAFSKIGRMPCPVLWMSDYRARSACHCIACDSDVCLHYP